jgi:hypothetical protein
MHERHSRCSSSWRQTFALQLLCLLLASSCHGLRAELPPARRLAAIPQQDKDSSSSSDEAEAQTSHECTSLKQLACRITGQTCQLGVCADTAALPPAAASPSPGRQVPGSSCRNHTDCAAQTPYCVAGKCRANCTADAQCRGLSPARPFCLQNKCRAQQCFYDSQCSSRPDMSSRPFCVDIVGAKRCRQCGQDSHCSSINPRRAACYTRKSTCVQVSAELLHSTFTPAWPCCGCSGSVLVHAALRALESQSSRYCRRGGSSSSIKMKMKNRQ